jgi:hypothetical protein
VLQIYDVVGEVNGRVNREADPRFRHHIRVDVLGQLTQEVGGEDFAITHVLDIN